MRMRNTIVSLIALSSLLGCTDFEAFSRGVCGNSVVEAGEYCDGVGQKDGTCIASTEPGACHFACTFYGSDGKPTACPNGQLCGTDNICRGPGGEFKEPLSFAGSKIAGIDPGDFDGDGRVDLLTYTSAGTEIHYFSASGAEEASFSIPGVPDQPHVVSLDLAAKGSRATSDLLMLTGDTIAAFGGQEDGTLQSFLFPSQIDSNEKIYRSVAISRQSSKLNKGLINFTNSLGVDPNQTLPAGDLGFLAISPEEPGPGSLESVILVKAGALVGKVAVGKLFPDADCESLVFMTDGAATAPATPKLHIYEACDPAIASKWPSSMLTSLPLPQDRAPWEGVWLANATNDMKPAIVFGTSAPGANNTGTKQLHAAKYTAGKDMMGKTVLQWDSTEKLLDVTEFTLEELRKPDMRKDKFECPPPDVPLPTQNQNYAKINRLAGIPLAIGDIDGDNRAEILDTLGALTLDSKDMQYRRVTCLDHDFWTAAHIGQLNATSDQKMSDFVVASGDAGGLIFLSSAGFGAFNSYFIPTANYILELVSSDFDGDLLPDLVVREGSVPYENPEIGVAEPGSPGESNSAASVGISVLFGNIVGGPDAPISLGKTKNAYGMTAGPIVGGDGIAELVLSTGTPGTSNSIYIFFGRSDRLLAASLVLVGQNSPAPLRPLLLIPGDFIGGEEGDAFAVVENGFEQSYGFSLLKDIGSDSFDAVSLSGYKTELKELLSSKKPYHAFGIQLTSQGTPADMNAGAVFDPMEAIFIGPDDETQRIYVFGDKADPQNNIEDFELKQDIALSESTLLGNLKLSKMRQPYDTPLRVADMDGDGLQDILGISSAGEVVVIWNQGDGLVHLKSEPTQEVKAVTSYQFAALVNPGAPGAGGADGTASSGIEVRDIAALNVDYDIAKELVVMTNEGVYLLDLVNRAFVEPKAPLSGINGRYITSGDFNGDGVDDIAVGGQDSFSLFIAVDGPPAPAVSVSEDK